jgi:hypothetical protein
VRIRAVWISIIGAAFGGLLGLNSTAEAQTAWRLWERPVDVKTGEPRGEWQSREPFEAERWCRGAMTRAINQSIAANSDKTKSRERAPSLSEFQCLPDGQDPRRTKGKSP